MSENTPAPKTSLEVTKTSLKLALTKAGYNYQKLLQEAEDVVFTKDNLTTAGVPIASLKKARAELDKKVNPHTAAWKEWNEAKASLMEPLDDTIKRKTGEFKKENDAVKAENARIKAEEDRKEGIKTTITNFTLQYSGKIAAATTNDELIALQKLLGAEKSRKNVYQEFMPDLFKAVEGLEEAMRKQKVHIQELGGVEARIEAAKVAGDEEAVVDLLADLGTIQEKIEDTKAEVQEQVINRATAYYPVEDARPAPTPTAKAARTTWAWRVLDIELLQRKHPDLVELVVKKDKIEAIIKERRENKTLKAVKEDGWEVYQIEHL